MESRFMCRYVNFFFYYCLNFEIKITLILHIYFIIYNQFAVKIIIQRMQICIYCKVSFIINVQRVMIYIYNFEYRLRQIVAQNILIIKDITALICWLLAMQNINLLWSTSVGKVDRVIGEYLKTVILEDVSKKMYLIYQMQSLSKLMDQNCLMCC